ncbi:tRNA (5-methylaminomethyl-2-thiouridine)(34)-methyltransferase MnmD [Flaviaesturariibacter amylovorans]|uniref:tRNA (5-methylaminomethyl-2-thiouridine)(34)-methyltransferase MnmD n=1 Tax=Flaviaesturariibacter amylovorans TaxID=1084520 RepID=A0ABP8HUH3_9BACT
MDRRIIATKDGSHTLELPGSSTTYHSRHGAMEESRHVFVHTGLGFAAARFQQTPLRIFEMGFGTGLNALLTAIEAERRKLPVRYTTIEAHPVPAGLATQLNFGEAAGAPELFAALHGTHWGGDVALSPFFTIRKEQAVLEEFRSTQRFHVIYYDAFAPSAQPELWTTERFRQLHDLLLPGGVLTTYCSKSVVRKAMEDAGLLVTKPPGPWGKREMVRAERTREQGTGNKEP